MHLEDAWPTVPVRVERGLALQRERFDRGQKKRRYAGLCKELTAWHNGAVTPWLCDAPIHPRQQTLKDLEHVYSGFFTKRADIPRFKKKGARDNFRSPNPKQIKLDQANSRLYSPKRVWLRVCFSREVLGTAVAPLNSLKRHENQLRKARPSLSRKRKFSNTGRRRKPESSISIPASATPPAISCTKPRPRSTKTTRWWVSRTCRCGTCPSWRKEGSSSRGEMFGPSLA